jgi:hypothetical protein
MPTLMVTQNLWRAIGGRAKLAARGPDGDDPAKLRAWSLREFSTSAGYLVVGLEETTYLTVVCPILALPDFILSFAARSQVRSKLSVFRTVWFMARSDP